MNLHVMNPGPHAWTLERYFAADTGTDALWQARDKMMLDLVTQLREHGEGLTIQVVLQMGALSLTNPDIQSGVHVTAWNGYYMVDGQTLVSTPDIATAVAMIVAILRGETV